MNAPDLSLATTDALMAEFQRRRQPVPTGVAIEQLAHHLQDQGLRQGLTISAAEARDCARAVVGPAIAPLAAVAPTWKRPANAAERTVRQDRAGRCIRRARRWRDRCETLGSWIAHACVGSVSFGIVAVFQRIMVHRGIPSHHAWALSGTLIGALALGGLSLAALGLHLSYRVTSRLREPAFRWEAQGVIAHRDLESWSVTPADLARFAKEPAVAAQLKGLLLADCPPLKLDKGVLDEALAQAQAWRERTQQAAQLDQLTAL